jgi:predicted phosphodiesterase
LPADVRFLILSDIHANLQALDAVLAHAASNTYDEVLVLGDLVGYGANPSEVIARTSALRPLAIVRGNHDKVCCGLEDATGFNDDARESAEWTAANLTAAERTLLKGLSRGPILVNDTIEICHGAPFDEDFYVFDQRDAMRAIAAMRRRICFFGHTHVPAAFVQLERHVLGGRPDEIVDVPADGRAFVNVGSVGQPRDGNWQAAYGVFDAERFRIETFRVDYDVSGAQERIRAAGLPAWHAERLAIGR